MKILIVTQYFWPENFKINEVALYLKERGHVVTVITGQPNYPEGEFYEGYSFFKPKTQLFNGVKIVRLPTVPRGKRNALKLILNYLLFPLVGRFFWKRLLKNKSFDIIFVCQLSPVFVGLLGARIKKKLNIPMVMWVLDLWPESVFAVSRIRPIIIEWPLKYIVNRIYHSCNKILVSSKPFCSSIVKYGYSEEKMSYMPNWADVTENSLTKSESEILPIFPKGFVILFAGNIGDAQDIETVLRSAELVSLSADIKWVFIGDGRKRVWLENEIIARKLENRVYWLGRFPFNTMSYFYQNASVLLVSLKQNPVFELTVPAKLQSYMASKKTILSMLSGAGNEIVKEARCGFSVESGDYVALACAVERLSKLSTEELESMGLNGYNYFQANFEKAKVLNHLESLLIREVENA